MQLPGNPVRSPCAAVPIPLRITSAGGWTGLTDQIIPAPAPGCVPIKSKPLKPIQPALAIPPAGWHCLSFPQKEQQKGFVILKRSPALVPCCNRDAATFPS